MSSFVVASAVMLAAMIPLGITAWRGTVMEAVVAYEAVSSIAVMVFIMLPVAFGRPAELEFPILLAALLLGSGLVFVQSLERWV